MGTAVIQKKLYKSLALSHLNDKLSYKRLRTNPLPKATLKINETLLTLTHTHKISTQTYKKLLPEPDCRVGLFYGLPKLHKQTLTIRPIISNVNHITANISQHIHTILTPTAQKAQTHIKNTQDLIDTLKKTQLTNNTFILTADIDSLYTSIPNEFGIEMVTRELYADKSNTLKPTHTNTFTQLLRTVLYNNYFEFNNTYYKQIKGTAMGTIMAPTYANTLLKHLEDKLLKEERFKKNTLVFKRYIDDIIVIYNNNDNTLPMFIRALKDAYKPLTLNIKYGKTLPFLDALISINSNTISTQLYKKPLNANTLLHKKSNHPKHTKTNVITQELLRIKRTCTHLTHTLAHETTLLKNALKQGYTIRDLEKAKKKLENPPNNTQENTQRVILTYNNYAETLAKEIKQLIPTLQITYRTEKNLKQLLTNAKLT